MAEHEKCSAGPAFEGRYYNVRNGCISRWDAETSKELEFEAVSGELVALKISWDEGNKASHVDPYEALEVDLRDDDGTIQRVKLRLRSTAGWTFASRIHNVSPGDLVRLRAAPGDNVKVSFCYIDAPNENGEWKILSKVEWQSSDRDRCAEQAVRSHEAFLTGDKSAPHTVDTPEAEFFAIAQESYGMPPYDAEPELYLRMFRRVFKDDALDASKLTAGQWGSLASSLIARFSDKEQWPREFKERLDRLAKARSVDAQAPIAPAPPLDEYDPFADD